MKAVALSLAIGMLLIASAVASAQAPESDRVRIRALEEEVKALKAEVAKLRAAIEKLKPASPMVETDIPAPQLVYKNKEDYKTGGGEFTRYNFTVKNRSAFPEELFKPAPDLPPIGLNKSASRTVVKFYDANDQYIHGFVALGSNASLDGIWFAVKKGQTPPEQVYVEFHDRKLDSKLKSDLVTPGDQPPDKKK